MPHAQIDVRRNYSAADEVAIIDAVHAALVAAFRIPDKDKHIVLVVHEPHRFAVPPGLAEPDRMTLVTIDAFAGRSLEAKRALYRAIVDGLDKLGIPADHVSIKLRDVPVENWGVRGGQAGCDVDLGFKIDVWGRTGSSAPSCASTIRTTPTGNIWFRGNERWSTTISPRSHSRDIGRGSLCSGQVRLLRPLVSRHRTTEWSDR